MLKKIVQSMEFYAFATLNLLYAFRMLRREWMKLKETDKADNKFHYVAIRFACGHYNHYNALDAMEQMKYDFKFYDVATRYHEASHIKQD